MTKTGYLAGDSFGERMKLMGAEALVFLLGIGCGATEGAPPGARPPQADDSAAPSDTGRGDSGGGGDLSYDSAYDGWSPGCYPEVDGRAPASRPQTRRRQPETMTITLRVVVAGSDTYDYVSDGVEYSASMLFEFSDWAGGPFCSITYDISGAAPLTGARGSDGAALYDAFVPHLEQGLTTCGPLDPAVWGTDDLRDRLEAFRWGFGWGALVEGEAELRSWMTEMGHDWDVDWAPYTSGAYLITDAYTGDLEAREYGYSWGYSASCGALTLDEGGQPQRVLAPTSGPMEDAFRYVRPLETLPLTLLLP